MAVPAGIVCAWPSTAASVPAGWTRATQLDGYHVRGAVAATNPGTTGGAANHAHTAAAHSHTFGNHGHGDGFVGGVNTEITLGSSGTGNVLVGHTHEVSVPGSAGSFTTSSDAASWAAQINDPAYLTVVWIQSDGTPNGLPPYSVAYFGGATLPIGWMQHPAGKAAYLKGAAAGADGGVAGSANMHLHGQGTHTHTGGGSHTHTTGTVQASATPTSVAAIGVTTATADNAHAHAVSGGATNTATADVSTNVGVVNTGSGTGEPPYYALAIIQNSSARASLPANVITLWTSTLASIPSGWAQVTALAQNFARGCNLLSEIGTTGGGTSHTHATGAGHAHRSTHTHTIALAADTSSTGPFEGTSVGGTVDSFNHTHNGPSGAPDTPSSTTGMTVVTSATETRPPFYDVAFIQYTASNTVSVSAPTAGGTVATPEVAAAWTLSGGRTQATYRVQIATDAGMTAVVFDTGTVIDATQSATVPAAPAGPPYAAQYGFVRGMTYYFQVTAADVNGVTSISSVVDFTATWTAPTVPPGLAVTPNTVALPYLGLIWTQVVPGGSDAFAHYNLYRRVTGTSAWTRIATVAAIATVGYADYNAEPGTAYDYAISATYTRSGSVFESTLSGTASGTLTFLGIYLHVATDPTAYCRWLGNASQVSAYQAQTLVQAWGRQAPSAYVGEAESVSYQLTSIADVPHTSQANWKAVLPLMQAQRTAGAVIHYRNGVTQQSTFGLLSGQQPSQAAMGSSSQSNVLTRRDTLTNTQTTIGIVPVSYSEAA